jgi:copper chaperone CopZ
MTATIKSKRIMCDGCAKNVVENLTKITGVTSVKVDVPNKIVTVDFDESKTDETVLRQVMTSAGYPPDA